MLIELLSQPLKLLLILTGNVAMQEDDNLNPQAGEEEVSGEEQETEEGSNQEPSTEAPSTSQKTDPLDGMDDSALRGFALGKGWKVDEALEGDSLRAEVKKLRSITQRRGERSTPPQKTEGADVLKKSDVEKAQERLAISQIEGSTDDLSKEISDNWDDIMKVYTPRHGRTTKEDILEDIYDAHAVWKRKHKSTDTSKEATAELAQVHGRGGSSPSSTPSEKKRILPKRQSMDKWYED